MARPKKYATPEEARAAKTAKQREARRVIASQLETISRGDISPCCRDWHDSSPHRGWRCRQHQDYDKFTNQSPARYRAPERHAGHGVANEVTGVVSSSDNDATTPDQRVITDLWSEWRDRKGKTQSGGFTVRVNPDSWLSQDKRDKAHDEWIKNAETNP